jgi:Na+/H+-dicarboxylate symporter
MRTDMVRRTRQVLLLFALTLSVIGMHHVPMSPHCTPHAPTETHAPAQVAMSTTAEAQPSCGGTGMAHDLLHLCLAVLYAAGGLLLLAWLLAAVGGGVPALAAGLVLAARRTWRPPGTAGRSLLTSICVLRA